MKNVLRRLKISARHNYDDLACSQDQALLDCYGISESELHHLPAFSAVESSDSDSEFPPYQKAESSISDEQLLSLLHDSAYNWFDFQEKVEECGLDVSNLHRFFLGLPNMKLDQGALELAVQSYHASLAIQSDLHHEDRIARVVNEEVVSESESSCSCDERETMIQKKRLAVKRRIKRQKKASYD